MKIPEDVRKYTEDPIDARRLLAAKNEAHGQPVGEAEDGWQAAAPVENSARLFYSSILVYGVTAR